MKEIYQELGIEEKVFQEVPVDFGVPVGQESVRAYLYQLFQTLLH